MSRIVIDDDAIRGVELEDGTFLEASVVVVGPAFRARTTAMAGLGLELVPHPSGLGDHIHVDEMGRTTVTGVYAAGNVTDPSQQVLHAAAAGSRVGSMVAADLAHADHEQRRRHSDSGDHSFDRDYWERHWSTHQQGDHAHLANPYLERELATVVPGTALDAGCGTGAEATWLAEAGWEVVAADISTDALDQARHRSSGHPAAERIHWLEDLTIWQPTTRFDLVVTSYAHPASGQLDFYQCLQHWVAPGGTLLIIGHDHGHGHESGHGRPPEHATTTAAALVDTLEPGEWTVDSAYETTRTVARGDGHVQLNDVVVRATATPDLLPVRTGRPICSRGQPRLDRARPNDRTTPNAHSTRTDDKGRRNPRATAHHPHNCPHRIDGCHRLGDRTQRRPAADRDRLQRQPERRALDDQPLRDHARRPPPAPRRSR